MFKCKSPNYILFETDDDGKKKIVSFAKSGDFKYSRSFEKDLSLSNAIEVPCGNCIACRLEYSRVWANRCYLESLMHEHTWFITLSYRDEDLPIGDKGFPTLEKNAISDFIRKLRDKIGHEEKIRFFGCGEYGDGKGSRQGFNPHYHIIVFGYNFCDLTIDMPDMTKPLLPSGKYPIFRRKNMNGDYVFWSKTIYDCWKKGKIEIEEAGWNCAAYVSRYVVKKQKGLSASIYDRLGIVPEFLRMSNRPGIGADWLIYNKNKLLKNDYLSVKNNAGVQTSRPPRYFEKLMLKNEDSIDAQKMEVNKYKRISNAMSRCDDQNTTKSQHQIAAARADALEKKTNVLHRDIT